MWVDVVLRVALFGLFATTVVYAAFVLWGAWKAPQELRERAQRRTDSVNESRFKGASKETVRRELGAHMAGWREPDGARPRKAHIIAPVAHRLPTRIPVGRIGRFVGGDWVHPTSPPSLLDTDPSASAGAAGIGEAGAPGLRLDVWTVHPKTVKSPRLMSFTFGTRACMVELRQFATSGYATADRSEVLGYVRAFMRLRSEGADPGGPTHMPTALFGPPGAPLGPTSKYMRVIGESLTQEGPFASAVLEGVWHAIDIGFHRAESSGWQLVGRLRLLDAGGLVLACPGTDGTCAMVPVDPEDLCWALEGAIAELDAGARATPSSAAVPGAAGAEDVFRPAGPGGAGTCAVDPEKTAVHGGADAPTGAAGAGVPAAVGALLEAGALWAPSRTASDDGERGRSGR